MLWCGEYCSAGDTIATPLHVILSKEWYQSADIHYLQVMSGLRKYCSLAEVDTITDQTPSLILCT